MYKISPRWYFLLEGGRLRKPTKLQRELISLLKELGGEATTRQISEASGPDSHNLGPRIGTGSVAFSLGQAAGYVKYCGMASRGNASWKLLKEPEPQPVKQSVADPQISLTFEDAS